jgi:hypothetical protein
MTDEDHIWEIRNPDGGAMGLEFSRGRMAAHDRVLAHALPERIDVEVRDGAGRLVARADGLEAEASTPMARLDLHGGRVVRENVWPSEEDIGKPVILAGGEIGILRSWWNADDHREWNWTLELHNKV